MAALTPEEREARNRATAEAVERLLALHARNPARTLSPTVLYLDPETVDPNYAYAYYAYADLEET